MEQIDNIFLQILMEIVQKHNLTIISMDLENHILDLDGDDSNLLAAAIEMNERLGEYLL